MLAKEQDTMLVVSSVNLLSSEEVNIKKKSNNIFSKIKELFTDG